MERPLDLEYSGKQKLFSYKVFTSLKYGQSDSIQKKESEEDERHSGRDNLVLVELHNRERS